MRPGDHGEVRRRALTEQRRRRMEAAGPSKRAVGGISRLSSRPSPSTPRQLPPMPLMCWLGLHKIYGKCSRRSTRYPTRRTSCSSSLERRGCHTLWLDFGEQPWNHTTNCTDTTSTTVSKRDPREGVRSLEDGGPPLLLREGCREDHCKTEQRAGAPGDDDEHRRPATGQGRRVV